MLDKGALRGAVFAASLVTELGILTVVGVFGGRWLDARLGTEPWLFALLTLAAFVLGTWRLISGIQRILGEHDDDTSDHSS